MHLENNQYLVFIGKPVESRCENGAEIWIETNSLEKYCSLFLNIRFCSSSFSTTTTTTTTGSHVQILFRVIRKTDVDLARKRLKKIGGYNG